MGKRDERQQKESCKSDVKKYISAIKWEDVPSAETNFAEKNELAPINEKKLSHIKASKRKELKQ